MCRQYGWWTQEADGHNHAAIKQAYSSLVSSMPNVVFFKTQKGHGVTQMVEDIKKWHYNKIDSGQELLELLND
jgi:transketolase